MIDVNGFRVRIAAEKAMRLVLLTNFIFSFIKSGDTADETKDESQKDQRAFDEPQKQWKTLAGSLYGFCFGLWNFVAPIEGNKAWQKALFDTTFKVEDINGFGLLLC